MGFGRKNKNSNGIKNNKQALRTLSLNPESEEVHTPTIPESYVQEEIQAFGEASQRISNDFKNAPPQMSNQNNAETQINTQSNMNRPHQMQDSPLFQLQRLDSPTITDDQMDVMAEKRGKRKRFGRKKQRKQLIEEQDEVYSNDLAPQEEYWDNQEDEEEANNSNLGFNVNNLEMISSKSKHNNKKKAHNSKKEKKKQRKISKNQERAMQQAANADATGFDPARMIELPEWDLPPWARKVFFGLVIIAVIIGLFVFGYFETDFNTDGEPTVVSIETRNERMYVNKSDELLQEVIDCASYIEENTADMSDYITISAEIQKQYDSLNADTTKLSKYTKVPSSMETYHTKLLNVSLGVQKLQTEILQKYQNSDYSDWRTSNIASMDSSLDTLHDMRFQIDERIWGDSQ